MVAIRNSTKASASGKGDAQRRAPGVVRRGARSASRDRTDGQSDTGRHGCDTSQGNRRIPTTREEAGHNKASSNSTDGSIRGAVTYVGRPCHRCGGVLRYSSNKVCLACHRARSSADSKRWRENNVEYNRARLRKWASDNREYAAACRRLRHHGIKADAVGKGTAD